MVVDDLQGGSVLADGDRGRAHYNWRSHGLGLDAQGDLGHQAVRQSRLDDRVDTLPAQVRLGIQVQLAVARCDRIEQRRIVLEADRRIAEGSCGHKARCNDYFIGRNVRLDGADVGRQRELECGVISRHLLRRVPAITAFEQVVDVVFLAGLEDFQRFARQRLGHAGEPGVKNDRRAIGIQVVVDVLLDVGPLYVLPADFFLGSLEGVVDQDPATAAILGPPEHRAVVVEVERGMQECGDGR